MLGELPRYVNLTLHPQLAPFSIKPAVVEGLAMPLNLSGPFLHRIGANQLHREGCLEIGGRRVALEEHALPEAGITASVYADQPITVEPLSAQYVLGRVGSDAVLPPQATVLFNPTDGCGCRSSILWTTPSQWRPGRNWGK